MPDQKIAWAATAGATNAGAVRFGAMFYYRTNRDQIGQINTLQPASAYTAHTVTIPNGPGGTVQNPQPTTATVVVTDPASRP